jgi:sugar O-acyltransferase (sialic acid O-acetyltransferase NeuD family)
MKELIIFGTSTVAEVAYYYFSTDTDLKVAAFTVDADFLDQKTFLDKPVVPFETLSREYPPTDYLLFIAVGYQKLNRFRQDRFETAKNLNYEMPSYISSRSVVAENVSIGQNCFILENQTIQPFCRIGDNVTLWSGNHIGHHSTIKDHAFIASHVVVSGSCKIGERSFLGVNASLRDGCVIGDDCFIGMNTSITTNVPAGGVAIGESSKFLEETDQRSIALKRKYFGISKA